MHILFNCKSVLCVHIMSDFKSETSDTQSVFLFNNVRELTLYKDVFTIIRFKQFVSLNVSVMKVERGVRFSFKRDRRP